MKITIQNLKQDSENQLQSIRKELEDQLLNNSYSDSDDHNQFIPRVGARRKEKQDSLFVFRNQRRKSVSKSITRQPSMSSHVEYTLKYVLNDDMAIPDTPQYLEPLIEEQIYFQDQVHDDIANFDAKSSYFSNQGDSRYAPVPSLFAGYNGFEYGQTSNSVVNLQKINNIYTSPFFLINS